QRAEFATAILQDCLARSIEWKQEHAFPLEVQRFLELAGELRDPSRTALSLSHDVAAWQRVPLDTVEHRITVFILIASPKGERLLGFSVEQPGWVLDEHAPILDLGRNWHEVFPDLAVEPSLENWRNAWRSWCHPRSLPPADVENSVLQRIGYKLSVTVP